MTERCCHIRKVKMTKILVVGLAMILAAAGSLRAVSTNGTGDQSTTQSTGNTGQGRGSGQSILRNQNVMRTGRHRDDQDTSRNGTNVTNGTGGTQMTNGTQGINSKPIPATNAGLRGGKRVLNF